MRCLLIDTNTLDCHLPPFFLPLKDDGHLRRWEEGSGTYWCLRRSLQVLVYCCRPFPCTLQKSSNVVILLWLKKYAFPVGGNHYDDKGHCNRACTQEDQVQCHCSRTSLDASCSQQLPYRIREPAGSGWAAAINLRSLLAFTCDQSIVLGHSIALSQRASLNLSRYASALGVGSCKADSWQRQWDNQNQNMAELLLEPSALTLASLCCLICPWKCLLIWQTKGVWQGVTLECQVERPGQPAEYQVPRPQLIWGQSLVALA